jgi:integrase
MFEQGASAKTTQAQLGHSDIQITLGTYTHIQGNAIYAAAEAMNKANQALEVMRR